MHRKKSSQYTAAENEKRFVAAVYDRLGDVAGNCAHCIIHRQVTGFGTLPLEVVLKIRSMQEEFDVDLPC